MTITDEELMKMNIDELKDNLKNSVNAYNESYANLKKHITDVLEHYIMELGMKDYAFVRSVTDNNAEIVVGKENNRDGYSIDLTYYYRYQNRLPHVRMNYWSFGSFDFTEKDKIDYMIALGKVAENLKNIEKDISDYDWKSYCSLLDKKESDDSLVARYKNIILRNERKEKEANILSKMKEGSKIIVDVRNRYEGEKIVRYDVIKTIGRITAKNIMFEEDYGSRTKKDYALGQLILGNWKLKEKESDTLVDKQD